jgi:hypothetical protein
MQEVSAGKFHGIAPRVPFRKCGRLSEPRK